MAQHIWRGLGGGVLGGFVVVGRGVVVGGRLVVVAGARVVVAGARVDVAGAFVVEGLAVVVGVAVVAGLAEVVGAAVVVGVAVAAQRYVLSTAWRSADDTQRCRPRASALMSSTSHAIGAQHVALDEHHVKLPGSVKDEAL